MLDHKAILNNAVNDGVINADQRWKLVSYFEGGTAIGQPDAQDAGLDTILDSEPSNMIEESEAPRFIRGFHDVLITIGLIIVLVGLGSLTNIIFVVIASWVLAEILVRRQRLALPAVALTLIYAGTALSMVGLFSQDLIKPYSIELKMLITVGCFVLLLVPFYWRFRVPISLAVMITSGLVFVFSLVIFIIAKVINIDDIFNNAPYIFNAIGFSTAVLLFAIAMRFDLKDRLRMKRWSDVAFWLHLITAPLLLYSCVSLILYQNAGAFWWAQTPQISDAVIIVACVLAMMIVGLVIERRAFVTSGLISLIVAAAVIFEKADMSWGNTTSIALFIVGLIVLTFGVGWQVLRKLVLRLMPQAIVQAVPPAV